MPDSKLSVLCAEDGLNHRERKFCHAYLMNGLDLTQTVKEIGKDARTYIRYLHKEHVQNYLKKRVAEVEEEFKVSFHQKIECLWRIVRICFPEGCTTEDLRLLGLRPEVAIKAIGEMNKMQGHYAPEELLLKRDPDLEKGNLKVDELIEKHKKEY
jgi:phage terminase small subunit